MQINDIYKCEVCGNIVESVHGGAEGIVCCGQKMMKLTENSVDASAEKHVPVIENDGKSVNVSVGSEPHPMLPEHHIEWIEVIDKKGKAYKEFLEVGKNPEARFCEIEAEGLIAREYCNLHGLWKNK